MRFLSSTFKTAECAFKNSDKIFVKKMKKVLDKGGRAWYSKQAHREGGGRCTL